MQRTTKTVGQTNKADDVTPANLAAVQAWLPAANALAEAVKDTLAAGRLARMEGLPGCCRAAVERIAKHAQRKANRVAREARKLREKAFDPSPVA